MLLHFTLYYILDTVILLVDDIVYFCVHANTEYHDFIMLHITVLFQQMVSCSHSSSLTTFIRTIEDEK